MTRRRASAIRREDPELDALVATLPGDAPAPRQQSARTMNAPFRGWRADQAAWVKETGRWGV